MKRDYDFPQFKPTKFDTVEDKEKFARQFIRFVESDFSIKQFPKWMYTRLSMTFSHIAHYDRMGFYNHFFVYKDEDFIKACLLGGGYGDPSVTYSDVERYLKDWLQEYLAKQ